MSKHIHRLHVAQDIHYGTLSEEMREIGKKMVEDVTRGLWCGVDIANGIDRTIISKNAYVDGGVAVRQADGSIKRLDDSSMCPVTHRLVFNSSPYFVDAWDCRRNRDTENYIKTWRCDYCYSKNVITFEQVYREIHKVFCSQCGAIAPLEIRKLYGDLCQACGMPLCGGICKRCGCPSGMFYLR